MSSIISINGKTYKGNSVTVNGNVVIIDGVIQDMPDEKNINITIEGSIDSLEVDVCNKVSVTGHVGKLRTMSGDVKCGNVEGNIRTMSGDVKCGSVSGKIRTMSGDVSKRLR